MFNLADDFTAFDENKQSYSFTVERHTETANLHAGVTEDGFGMKSVGNRFILNSPRFKTGVFEMDFTISYPYEVNPCFMLIIGYNKMKRSGIALKLFYGIGANKLSAQIVSLDGKILSDMVEREWHLQKSGAHLALCIEDKFIKCTVDDVVFEFDFSCSEGYFAIDRSSFIGALIIKRFTFCIQDELSSEEVLRTEKIEIPMINGGDIPYTISYAVERIDGEYYLSAALDGGTKSRPKNKKERAGQYIVQIDWMDTPYVGLYNGGEEVIFSLANGKKCFVDPNVFWDCQKIFFEDTELPLKCTYKLDGFAPNENTEFIFGYKNLFCRGYAQQEGGAEFRFSHKGEPVWRRMGKKHDDVIYAMSPENKKAVSLIPTDCAEYEKITAHLKQNHYFAIDENVEFTMIFETEIKPDYLMFAAEIKNVFEDEVLFYKKINAEEKPCGTGYELSANVCFSPIPIGVYKIVFTVLYGDMVYRKKAFAFEVYDDKSELCPPIESGLPFMFTMNNEHKKLVRNGFDLTNPMPSCDFEHYIACATTTPVEAEALEIWRTNRIFGRKWFAWLAIRTCDDYLSPSHKLTLQNADYLFHTGINTDCDPLGPYSLYPNRIDHWRRRFYIYPEVRELISKFFAENPNLAEKTGYRDAPCELTTTMYEAMMTVCADELIEYLNSERAKMVAEHNRELESVNPSVKRAIYGPLTPYNSPTLTYHSLKYLGLPDDERLRDEFYNGFAIFEDYPFACAYQTYRGAFVMMTLLLKISGLTIYPELYVGSAGGCIDGAVKYAHAPMGDYDCPSYQNSTQAFEYVYNTCHKTEKGFKYWDSYGFHRGLCNNDYINAFVKNWRYVVRHKPKKPFRSAAYVVHYDGDKDVRRPECNFYNRSESGQTVFNECARESGIPCGFGIDKEGVLSLTKDDTDLLILGSLSDADGEYIAKIRSLYNEGVNLVALSDVSGLEDLFGVCVKEENAIVKSVEYDGKREFVYNTEAQFKYAPVDAEVTVTANNTLPAVIETERTALINTELCALGCADKTKMGDANGAFIVGTGVRRALTNIAARLSLPKVLGVNVGTTLFYDEKGRKMLLAISYTPFDNRENEEYEAIVKINMPEISDAESDIRLMKAKRNGTLEEIRFNILPHGFAFIELK